MEHVVERSAERVLEEEAQALLGGAEVEPVTDPLQALAELLGEVLAVKSAFAAKVDELRGLTVTDQLGREDVRALLAVYERSLDRCGTLLVSAARLNIDDRIATIRSKVSDAQAQIVGAALSAVLANLALSAELRQQAQEQLVERLQDQLPLSAAVLDVKSMSRAEIEAEAARLDEMAELRRRREEQQQAAAKLAEARSQGPVPLPAIRDAEQALSGDGPLEAPLLAEVTRLRVESSRAELVASQPGPGLGSAPAGAGGVEVPGRPAGGEVPADGVADPMEAAVARLRAERRRPGLELGPDRVDGMPF